MRTGLRMSLFAAGQAVGSMLQFFEAFFVQVADFGFGGVRGVHETAVGDRRVSRKRF